jgi:ATP synthase F1 gamma subunit
MAENLRALRVRLKNIGNISQVTKAMKLVSAAKYSRFIRLRQASKSFRDEIDLRPLDHLELNPPQQYLLLSMGTERGFCGSYNYQLAQTYWKTLRNKKKTQAPLLVAFQGRRFLQAIKRLVKQDNLKEPLVDHTSFSSLFEQTFNPEIFYHIKDSFKTVPQAHWCEWFLRALEKQAQNKPLELSIVYQKFISAVEYNPTVKSLIIDLHPVIHLPEDLSRGQAELYHNITLNLYRLHLLKEILDCFEQSGLSEHAARRNAMDAAEKNAKEIRKNVKQKYQRARQAAITNEIIEIISGVEVLKKKQKH